MLPHDDTLAEPRPQPRQTGGWLPELAVFCAALIGRLPALGAWWQGSDWGHLARAAGLQITPETPAWPARWLSQHLYWDLTWPLFGLNADAHSLLRLGLHGLAAVLVVRVAWRSGLGPLSRLLAGLVFAASPLAFAPLYQASGVQEMLAGVFALAALERWLAAASSGRNRLAWASVLAVLGMLCSETALGLPLLFLACVWLGVGVDLRDKAFAWAMIMLQLLVAVVEGVLVVSQRSLASGAAAGIAGGPASAREILTNLGDGGWWLMSPGPELVAVPTALMTAVGLTVFVAWFGWGVVRLRQGAPLALLAAIGGVLVLTPALVLKQAPGSYPVYLAAAPVALLVADIAYRARTTRLDHLGTLPLLGFMSLVALAWAFFGMEARLERRDQLGLVADPVARATALSWQACRTIGAVQANPAASGGALTHLTLLQPLAGGKAADLAADLGERWTLPSDLYRALDGTNGPRLLLGENVQVSWANGLTTAPSKALVLCETTTGFKLWGQTGNAVLYAALTDIGLGHFARARDHLVRAAQLGGDRILFIYDAGQMAIPLDLVKRQKEAFIDWTLGLLHEGVAPHEVAGLQDMFYNLLGSATGRSPDELKAGSTLLPVAADTSTQR